MKIAVWFSCGVASAVAAKKTVEKYGSSATIHVVNNPVMEEHPDNGRFLHDIEQWIGMAIERAVNSKYPSCSVVDVWRKRRYMSGPDGAPCTVELKKMARQQWEAKNLVDWHVLGFTADEQKRHDNFILGERSNLLPVLIDAGLTKADCFQVIQAAGITLPEVYRLGYPNANCIGCVKATSPTYWNHVRQTNPRVFAARAAQSRHLGARLVRVKGERLFLDELSPDAVGQPLKSLDLECNSFCEERHEEDCLPEGEGVARTPGDEQAAAGRAHRLFRRGHILV